MGALSDLQGEYVYGVHRQYKTKVSMIYINFKLKAGKCQNDKK